MMVILSVNFAQFLGRFHPVLVHMPVGILMLAAIFIWLAKRERFESLRSAISISLFLGMLSAIASCVTGFLLSKTDSYEETLLFKHQWFAIATALIAFVLYYLHLKNRETKWVAAVMVLLVMITGHLGGSITHGSDFLTKAFSSSGDGGNNRSIPNVQESNAFSTVIMPILEAKCIACHGPNKQKGKLRLDEPGFIFKGGEDGSAIVAGNAAESAMIKKILLPKENKDHMPPAEKPQLSKQDVELLKWWITTGAKSDQKVKDLPQTDQIKSILKSLESGKSEEHIAISYFPEQTVAKAPETALLQLRDRGIAIVPIAQNSNFLSANFVAVESFTGKDLQLLEPVKKQLIWLKLGNLAVSDDDLSSIGKLVNLRMLYLQKTKITDQGLPQLGNLSELQYLNLGETKVTAKGVEQLKGLKNLRQLYLFQTNISGDELDKLRHLFPEITIDAGGYGVPKLVSDTSVLRAPIIK